MIPAPTSPTRYKNLLSGRPPQTEFVQSPSQYDKFLECNRWAGLEYIDGYREGGQNDYRVLGDRIHDILEEYVKTGKKPDVHETFTIRGEYMGKPYSRVCYPGQIADVAICSIPPGGVAESEVILTSPNGVKWKVKRDLRSNVIHQGRQVREVRDYKTTGDLKKADEKHLPTDTQATVYAWAEFQQSPELTEVLLHWQFLRTKGKPDSRSKYFLATPAHVEEQFKLIAAGAERWVALRRKGAAGEIRGADLEPTGLRTGACDKGFGCPHRGTRCKLSDTDLLAYAMKGNQGMDINAKLAELAGRQQAVGAIPAPAAYVPQPAPLSRPSYWIPGDPMNANQVQLQAMGMPLSVVAMKADNPPPAELGATYDKAVQAPVERGFINSSEAPPVPAINPQAMAAMIPPPVAAVASASLPTDDAKARRKALKEEAKALGLVGDDCKLGEEKLAKMIADFKAGQSAPVPAPVQVAAPAPVRSPEYARMHAACVAKGLVVADYEPTEDALRALCNAYRLLEPASVPAPVSVPAPAPVAMPAPTSALVIDDALLDQIAQRLFARICKALTFA